MIQLTEEQERVREILKKVAQNSDKNALITYNNLVQQAHLHLDMGIPDHRRQMGLILGAVSAFEVENGRPMLSCLVKYESSALPAKGFLDLARELGKLPKGTDGVVFLSQEINRAKDYWQKQK